jgi:hypothetical protein
MGRPESAALGEPMAGLSYNYRHQVVAKVHGPARDWGCVDCGATARHWACAGDYALLWDYVPMCIKCHKAFDLGKLGSAAKIYGKAELSGRNESVQSCGTTAGYQRHKYWKEDPCSACLAAQKDRTDSNRAKYGRRGSPLPKPPDPV